MVAEVKICDHRREDRQYDQRDFDSVEEESEEEYDPHDHKQ